jgi:hypothetical protein
VSSSGDLFPAAAVAAVAIEAVENGGAFGGQILPDRHDDYERLRAQIDKAPAVVVREATFGCYVPFTTVPESFRGKRVRLVVE